MHPKSAGKPTIHEQPVRQLVTMTNVDGPGRPEWFRAAGAVIRAPR